MKDTINAEIIEVAQKYLGQQEISGNMGFKDEDFSRKMEAVGHDDGEAWCALFTELVWKEAYQQWDATLFNRLDKLFNDGAVTTFRNFQKTRDFIVSSKPIAGALAVWQKYSNGRAHWTGHIAIVESFNMQQAELNTIDGNTNDKGGREGYIVARIKRDIDFRTKQNGLVLLGFIHPKEI